MLSEITEAEERRKRIWFRAYLVSAALANFGSLLCLYVAAVPGMYVKDQLWLACFAGVLLLVPLVIGMWRFRTREAPLTIWPLGPVVGVILILEFAWFSLGIIQLSVKVLH